MELLNCVEVQEQMKIKLKEQVQALGEKPYLTIVQVGDNPASNRYIGQKIKHCTDVGIEVVHVKLPELVQQSVLMLTILQEQKKSHGIIVQLPLPDHMDVDSVMEMIDPQKDVDGLTSHSKGMLYEGYAELEPCTALGIIKMLDHFNIPIEGKEVLMIGRSEIVGKPLSMMLLKRNATVTMAHSKTCLERHMLREYDIVIGAIGKAKALKGFVAGTIIDVGINFDENGKMCGDFDPELNTCDYYTPVPGGVGRMTIIGLIENVISATKNQQQRGD